MLSRWLDIVSKAFTRPWTVLEGLTPSKCCERTEGTGWYPLHMWRSRSKMRSKGSENDQCLQEIGYDLTIFNPQKLVLGDKLSQAWAMNVTFFLAPREQVGSIITVAALSFTESFVLQPQSHILCVSCCRISGFRWISWIYHPIFITLIRLQHGEKIWKDRVKRHGEGFGCQW